jgi:hypothetical protein
VFSAETVLFVGGLGLLLTLPAMGVAWAHLALRASTVEDRFFLAGGFLFTKSLTAWLAVLVTGVLASRPLWSSSVRTTCGGRQFSGRSPSSR